MTWTMYCVPPLYGLLKDHKPEDIVDEIGRSAEICATEELSFHLEAANKKLVELGAKPFGIGSLDVIYMFLNLKTCYVKKMVMQALLSSNIFKEYYLFLVLRTYI